MKKRLILMLLMGAILTLPALAADIPGSKDNPYTKRFDSSEIVQYKARNFDTLTFYEKDVTKPVALEGKLIRIIYRVAPEKTSALEVCRNYEAELKSKGFDILHSGTMKDLGVDNVFIATQAQAGGFVTDFWAGAYQNTYDISAIKHDPEGDIHIHIAICEMTGDRGPLKAGEVGILIDALQVKGVTNKMVDGTASDMSKQIASTGSVNLYGIYFDTDKTEVKPESKPTLDEVGKLLTGDATLKLKVVGHTDNTGSPEHNQTLSLGRAKAVVSSLVTGYGITADRLQPEGLAATKPIASNDTEEGRAKNRRVELVKL